MTVPFVWFDLTATSRAVERGAVVISDATDGPAGRAVTVADPGSEMVRALGSFRGRNSRIGGVR